MNKPGHVKVLLVDDDDDLLDSMRDLFQLFNFSVETARSGEIAWEILQKNDFDVVLTDIRMSQMTGLKLLENIKKRDRLRPKVIIASSFSDYSAEELYAAGADAFFQKPFQASTVRDFLWQAAMTPAERWAIKLNQQPTSRITARFASLKQAKADQKFSLGQLGFYYRQSGKQPSLDEWIEFSFQFDKEKKLPLIEGTGKVRWLRDDSSQGYPAGIGVEIKYLSEECLAKVIEWLAADNTLPNIPRL